MAGLLKQIQKQKSKYGSAISEVLIRPGAAVTGTGNQLSSASETRMLDGLHEGVVAADSLLKEIIAEAKQSRVRIRPDGNTDSTSMRIVRRRSDGNPVDSSSGTQTIKVDPKAIEPAWLSAGYEFPPQVQFLVETARKDLEKLVESGESEDEKQVVRQAVREAMRRLAEQFRFNKHDQEQAEAELLLLLRGVGPLEPLFNDELVTDIFVDGHKSIKVARCGQSIDTPCVFRSAEEYRFFLDRLIGRSNLSNQRFGQAPIVDFILNDEWKSRVNMLGGNVVDGGEPRLCIRIPRMQHVTFYDLLQAKVLPVTVAAWLTEVLASREVNLLIVGPAGSGKTAFVSALVSAIGSGERVVVIENQPEIAVNSAGVERLLASSGGGTEERVGTVDLLSAALRRAPHRVVVGELDEEIAKPYLRMLEGGQTGSIATIHSHSAIDAMWRLLDLIASGESAGTEALMRRVARSVHLIVTMGKVDDRSCVTEVAEVVSEGGEFRCVPLVSFAGSKEGKRSWHRKARTSRWLDWMKARGAELKVGSGLVDEESESVK